MRFIKIFLCFLLFISQHVLSSQVWQLSDFKLSSDDNGILINLQDFKLPFFDESLSDISYRCHSSQQLYPIHKCEQGELNFSHRGDKYHVLLNGWFNALNNQWKIDIFNQDSSIVLHLDSKNQQQLKIDFNQLSLESLLTWIKPYYEVAVTATGNISSQVVIDLTDEITVLADYHLSDFSWESDDGQYILAESQLSGTLAVKQKTQEITIEIFSHIDQGEGLFTDIYTNFQQYPISVSSQLRVNDQWQVSQWQVGLSATEDIKFDINVVDWQNLTMDIKYNVKDLNKLYQAFLESYLGILGINDAIFAGRSHGQISLENGAIAKVLTQCKDVSLSVISIKTDIQNFDCNFNWKGKGGWQTSVLSWQKLLLAGMPIDQAEITLMTVGQQLSLREETVLPVFDGSVVIHQLVMNDIFSPDISIQFDGEVMPISLALITEKMGWPLMNGSISGKIPGMKKIGQSITFDGSLDLTVFDGYMRIDHLSMERLFGIAPVIAADISFEQLNLEQVTSTFDFGDISGLIKGYVNGLRVTNWKPDRLDAYVESTKVRGIKQSISQRAIDNISSIGGVQGALSRSFLRFFKNFKYKRIGIGCKLRNAICEMRGIEEKDNIYRIVEGKGLPSINIMGISKFIDWEIFLDRLLNAGY